MLPMTATCYRLARTKNKRLRTRKRGGYSVLTRDDGRTHNQPMHVSILLLSRATRLFAARGRVAARGAEVGVETLCVPGEVVLARERLRALVIWADVVFFPFVHGGDVLVPIIRPVEH